jgi:tRNA (guanine-N7-)-methyltransferase
MSGKKKLAQFAEIGTFANVIQVPYAEVFNKTHALKGHWISKEFKNENPLVLELGCGKGEYTIGMARKYPERNFIGVDIKGARMWRGAKTAIDEKIDHARFLRTRIEFIDSFFDKEEVDEIWITFPDPQPQLKREKKRLTSPRFLSKYLSFLKKDGFIHLKTDARSFYEYTLETADAMSLNVEIATDKLYHDLSSLPLTSLEKEILNIPTFYEKKFKEKGHEITYIKIRN